MFTPTDILDWGAATTGSVTSPSNTYGLGEAYSTSFPEPTGTTLYAGVSGMAIQITSDDMLARADNAGEVWSNTYNSWIPTWAGAPGVNFFGGNFGTATSPSRYSQFSQYGADLLGALAPSGPSQGMPEITFNFSMNLSYVAFQVSSATNANFTAELIAFNSQGQQIGTYQVNDTGDGGNTCATLSNPTGPTPCNTAPLIQFYDPNQQIASVELVMLTDLTGVYIDSLEVAPVPEPVTSGMAVTGLALILWTARRRRLRNPAAAPRD